MVQSRESWLFFQPSPCQKTPKYHSIPCHSCHNDGFVSGSLSLRKVRGALEVYVTRGCCNCHDRCHCSNANLRHRLSLEASTKSHGIVCRKRNREVYFVFRSWCTSTVWPNLRLSANFRRTVDHGLAVFCKFCTFHISSTRKPPTA
jgi:hypothetical protein